MNTKLKECPFCGGADVIYIRHVDGTVRRLAYFVVCDNCGAQSRATDRGDHVEIWNARAIAPPVAAGSVDMEEAMAVAKEIVNFEDRLIVMRRRAEKAEAELEQLKHEIWRETNPGEHPR